MRNSNSLRQAIRLKLHRDKTTVAAVCQELGITRPKFAAYLSGSVPKAITQYKLLKFCEKIGINVALKVEIKDL